jgi:hypothetical protein
MDLSGYKVYITRIILAVFFALQISKPVNNNSKIAIKHKTREQPSSNDAFEAMQNNKDAQAFIIQTACNKEITHI